MSSRRLVVLFVLLTLVPSAVVLAFGWRLLQQEEARAGQQRDLRQDEAADLAVSAFERAIAVTEDRLRDRDAVRAAAASADSIVLLVDAGRVEALPHGRLLYHPVGAPGPSAPDAVFAAGEELEHRDGDPGQAAAWFRRLAASAEPAVRAGALVRAARNLSKAGAHADALTTYSAAAEVRGTAIGEVPTELFARWARCSLLERLGRGDEVRKEALELRELLLDARWAITRPVFEMHFQAASGWSRAGEPVADFRLALAEAAEQAWKRLGAAAETTARSTITARGIEFTVLTQRPDGRTAVLVAGPAFLRQAWQPAVAAVEQRHGVQVALMPAVSRSAASGGTRRTAVDTGLPWTVVAQSSADPAPTAARRNMWIAGMAVLALLAVTGTYVVGRAVSRELAVARLQSDFVAAVSHEFRTPLTSLRQLSEMLLERPASPPDKRLEYYRALQRQTERLQRLVESLLDFGRMEAGTSPYRLLPLDASGLVADVVEQFRAEHAGHHRIDFTPASPAIIAADRDALCNALWNLLDNAVKYSPHADAVRVEVACSGSEVAIRVRDQGFGIPAAEQREIFRKFVRGAQAKAERIRGTGLGLAMVRHIVSGHGGRVTVDSEPGRGSTFSIVVPAAMSLAAENPALEAGSRKLEAGS